MLQWLGEGRRGDLDTMGLSSGPTLVWMLVGVVTLQSNQSGRAVGSRGQVYTRGQTVPNHVAPKWKFQECETSVNLYWVMLHVIQLPGWCSSISSLLSKFTLLIRNTLRSWWEIDWDKCFVPLKVFFGDPQGEISWLSSPMISFLSATTPKHSKMSLNKGFGLL